MIGLTTAPAPAQVAPCRITSIAPQNGKMVIRWQGGEAPYQVQMRPSMSASWQDIGAPTSICCVTNAVSGPMGFFRIMCVTNTPAPAPTGGGPQLVGFFPAVGFSRDVAVSGGVAYMATEKWGLSLVGVQNPSAPVLLGSSKLPFTGNHVAVVGSIAAVTGTRSYYDTNTSPPALTTVSGLYILNVATPANVTVLGSIEGNAVGYNGVAISGNHVYAACGGAGLQIINISTPSNPTVVATFDTPGWANGVTVAGNHAYVADGGQGLRIVNVANPAAPYGVGFVDTPGTAQYVSVEGTLACVADYNSVRTVDVGNPAAPVLRGTLATSAQKVKLLNGIAYVAAGSQGMVVVDVRNPASPVSLGSLPPTGGQYASTQGLFVNGTFAYLANSDGGLGIVNAGNPLQGPLNLSLSSHLMECFSASYLAAKPGLAVATGARLWDGGSGVANGLRVIDTSNPGSPRIVGGLESSTLGFLGLSISGNHAFVACGPSGIRVVNIASPTAPVIVGLYDTPGWANSVTVVGNYAYVADGSMGLRILNISNPTAPTLVGFLDTPGVARSVDVVGTHAYVADGNYLQIIDVSNPASPQLRGTIAVKAVDVKVKDNYAYCAAGGIGLVVVDVHAPTTPTQLAVLPPRGGSFASTQGVCLSGNTAYVANTDGGLAIVDITSPGSPTVQMTVLTIGNPKNVIVDGNWVCMSDDSATINTINLAP